jgi:methyl-accepting chemotaxis protein
MRSSWTFSQKIAAGFVVNLILTLLLGAVAIYALRNVVASKDGVITVNTQILMDALRVDEALESKVATSRGFLLTRQESSLENMLASRDRFLAAIQRLKTAVASERNQQLVREIESGEAAHQKAQDQVIAMRRGDVSLELVGAEFADKVQPLRDQLRDKIDALVASEETVLESARLASTAAATTASAVIVGMLVAAMLLAIAVALVLTRTLGQQIGSAVQHVQSSSSELQTAATQQATGAREQSTAMSEISTTINELLATSKQIAESAQRVAQIADSTAKSARSGEQTVTRTGDSIATIRRQVDLIVTHMLDLGKKSQQIGGILELINELSEQTNILAINATIEAAGAGESGKRFAVVADEIRKLADRVGGSTKEIRGLVEEVRSAVNTTVMTTESGSKAVDAGTRQFAELAEALKQIVKSVATTTEAAREIELSTKQQSTAVEQVNVAISNVSQATRETETSASQILQTASQMASLSRDLLRLIQPQAGA